MKMMIEPLGEGKYKMLYQGHSPYPANPYTVWWPCLRQEPNGCNWEYRLTKDEVMERLDKQMKDPEDEAFEQLALKQGQWEHTSGWRKRQIEQRTEGVERNAVLEEVAVELETKFTLPFGRDTVQSFAQYIRGMKR